MTASRRLLLVLAVASLAAAPPLLAGRDRRADAPSVNPERRPSPAPRGDRSEPAAPAALAPQRPAVAGIQPRITPFCEPVPEKFFIDGLGSIATDLGTAGYVIDRPGHYILTRDIEAQAVDIGILVRGHGVILDLRGHTISDREGESVLIAVDRGRDTSIRNGTLKGGAAAIDAFRPNDGNAMEHLDISRIRILAHASSERYSVSVAGLRRVNIEGMEVSGGSRGVSILGSSGSRIIGSRIEASQEGLRLYAGIRVIRSTIEAPDAVVVDSGRVDLTGNRIIGGATGAAALRIAEGYHRIRHNRIQAAGAAAALYLSGNSIVQSNEIRGGSEAVVVTGRTSRLTGNSIAADATGIRVAGDINIIEGNLIAGTALQCGISFEGGPQNVYRNNTLEQGSVCGEPNIDGGGNSTGPCAGVECATRRFRISPLVFEEADEDRFSRAESSAPPCGAGDIVAIADWGPVQTQYGKAGLLIDESGYYRLANDLHATEEDYETEYAIVITGRDVTLDLGHHVVDAVEARPLLIAGSVNVVIRNGEFRGGSLGLRAIGDATSTATGLRLERIWLWRGSTSGYQSFRTENFRRVEIIDSRFHATEVHSTIEGPTTGIIRGTSITGVEGGLWAYEFDDGVLSDNSISGDYSLSLGSGNLLRRNDIGAASMGARNRVEDSLFHGGQYNEDGLRTEGDENVIRDSWVTGVVTLSSSRNRLVDSIVGNGIEIRGESNTIENNFISGYECGAKLETDAAHVYRNNVIVDAHEGFCGFPNQDGGGNVVPSATCGNMITAVTEVCDSNYYSGEACRALGFKQGEVRCNQTCDGYDSSGCHTCGDGVRGGWEVCDGTDLNGQACVSRGFDGGVLSCTSECGFDRSDCIGGCGNGILEGREVCDVGVLRGETCATQGFVHGNLACNHNCTGYSYQDCHVGCGNELFDPGEECDRTAHYGACARNDFVCTCSDFNLEGGKLGCTNECRLDFSGCAGAPNYHRCGDGIIQGPPAVPRGGEVCDGASLAGKTCASYGFEGGALACSVDCTSFNLSGCFGGCGNGSIEGMEECDRGNLNGLSCISLGFEEGKLYCDNNCLLDTSWCSTCGNAVKEAHEVCDGTDLGGATCASQGRPAGTLLCNASCGGFDTSQCIGF